MTLAKQPVIAPHERIRRSFQRGFQTYHSAAKIQKDIANKLAEYFVQTAQVKHLANLLEVGCGTGFLTRALLQNLSVEHWTQNDLVPESEAHVAPLLCDRSWEFLPGAIETLELPQNFDLITSASAIQWIPDTPALIKRLSASLNPGGWLVLSSFAPAHFKELQALGVGAQKMSYHDKAHWQELLPADVVPKLIVQERQTARFPTIRDVLLHLRSTGVNANSQQQWSRLKLAEFERDYRYQFSDQNQNLCLTYAPIYIIGQKKRC